MKLLTRKTYSGLEELLPICKILLGSSASSKNTLTIGIPFRMSQFQFSLAKKSLLDVVVCQLENIN